MFHFLSIDPVKAPYCFFCALFCISAFILIPLFCLSFYNLEFLPLLWALIGSTYKGLESIWYTYMSRKKKSPAVVKSLSELHEKRLILLKLIGLNSFYGVLNKRLIFSILRREIFFGIMNASKNSKVKTSEVVDILSLL